MSEEQLTLFRACKQPGCTKPVVSCSITGEGSVCTRHNELEWAHAMAQSDRSWIRETGAQLLASIGPAEIYAI